MPVDISAGRLSTTCSGKLAKQEKKICCWVSYSIFIKVTCKPSLNHHTRFLGLAWDKCLGLVHWEDPEESDGEGAGKGVSRWGIHVNVWQKPVQYCKVISLQLIKVNEKK